VNVEPRAVGLSSYLKSIRCAGKQGFLNEKRTRGGDYPPSSVFNYSTMI